MTEVCSRRHVQMGALPVMCTWIFSLVGVCGYPCDSGSGDASRPVGVDLPVKHAEPSDDSRLKNFKSV